MCECSTEAFSQFFCYTLTLSTPLYGFEVPRGAQLTAVGPTCWRTWGWRRQCPGQQVYTAIISGTRIHYSCLTLDPSWGTVDTRWKKKIRKHLKQHWKCTEGTARRNKVHLCGLFKWICNHLTVTVQLWWELKTQQHLFICRGTTRSHVCNIEWLTPTPPPPPKK